jgi:hypothetical protein
MVNSDMRKYVLNIDELHSGWTASALVLRQVDEEFPVLIPSPPSSGSVSNWLNGIQKMYPVFNPFEQEFELKYTVVETIGDNKGIKKFKQLKRRFLQQTPNFENIDEYVYGYVISVI